ncbi:UvrD-helicase domain-containing protein [Streptomyces sp. SL13]|uniref:DNA 3'-5' helicase n=1 Tax=Streptantibioticus silvisoli TaxID=2705255 RepID=A0AA90H327_9ACTN|nr:UvrD-helicase domain-containing protein [Streptantibioticus silvisoli]MDI5970411.1 UvrD-helicase domain-containing protein [Streptantibioticus silvisoli]
MPPPPSLDAGQRAVVEHRTGPLLVLAGPGTGKTTTLVEAVVDRVARGADPERLLVLTDRRAAAATLRDRLAARLGGRTAPRPTTFHSLSYALVRAEQDPDAFAHPLRLLSGPEQDLTVRELLAGEAELARSGRASVRWPKDLRAALTTRGFADEVRAVLARTRELGLGPGELAAFADRTGRPDWAAAAGFLAEYLDVLGLQGAVDYAELVRRAVAPARDRAGDWDAVFVDEIQDTDPAQVRLLRAIAGGGRTLVAFGDPDQSIYAFRGADVGGVLDFPGLFPAADGSAAPVIALTTSYRAGPGMLAATRRIAGRMPLTRLPARVIRAHREPVPSAGAAARPARVEVLTFPTAGSETDNVADLLRRAHLEDDVPWADMAVLVRAGARSLPVLRRALTSAGVPVEIDGDDLPLREEPAVAPLLLALRVAARAALHTAGPTTVPPARTAGEEGVGDGTGADGGATGDGRAEGSGTEGGGTTAAEAGEEAGPDDAGLDGVRPDGAGVEGVRPEDATPEGAGREGADPHPAGAERAGSPDVRAEEAGPLDVEAEGVGSPDVMTEAANPDDAHAQAVAAETASPDAPHARAATPEDPTPEDARREAAPEAAAPEAPHPQPPAPLTVPDWLPVEDALTLLASPLGGMDAADLRRLGRALREEERAGGRAVPSPSDRLITAALAAPERLIAHDDAYARGARRLGELLRAARTVLAAGGTAEAALWELWSGTPWPARLERLAARGGAAARNADRDLDAACALFETAARAEQRTGGRGALNFLEELDAQDIAADVLTRRAVRPDAVLLTTAHRSKGRQWRMVVVAGVQDGLWPDLRRRGSLLEADRIGRDGLAEPLPPGALLAEERRLFYVAVTRASERLVVTAVKGPADDGDQPSRFLAELGVEPRDVTARPRRPLAVAALVAELRATTVDPAVSPALRRAAAARLARLAALTDDEGYALVPAAHPQRWWGLREPTHAESPLRDPAQPVALSGSALGQLVDDCSLRWFLGREVKADDPSTAAQGFGNVVHVLADEVASRRTPARLDVLMERLDSVWDALAFDAPWKSKQEREQARVVLERFLHWHVMERGREPVASEREFDVTLEAGPYQVRVRGSMDLVERDAEGRVYVVDFKTGKRAPTAAEVERHPQLAVYQLALRDLDAVVPGGAELVHLRQAAPKKEGGDALPKTQAQPPIDTAADDWPTTLLATAAATVLEERFTPSPGRSCDNCAFHASCSARPEGRQVVE